MFRSLTFVGMLLVTGAVQAQQTAPRYNPADFNLKPGEILVSVDGVPVGQATSGSPTIGQSTSGTTVTVAKPSVSSQGTAGQYGSASQAAPTSNPLVVNRDPAAYAHALREAQIIASRGENYHQFGDGGHPLGIAPGCRYAGTGYSRDRNRPNHCYQGELPESRLVARAMVPGPGGTYFWSAHYR